MTRPRPTETRQDEIARAAALLFNEKGYHQTSMEDVAAAIGLRKPTLYHYVKSKAQLVSWIHDECVNAVLPPLRGYIDADMPGPEILLRVASDIFGLLDAKPGYLRVYFEHHRDLPPRERTRGRRQRDEYYTLVKQVLDEGVRRGEFHVENTELAAMGYFGMCNWAYQWYRPNGPLRGSDIAQYLWRHFLNGILTVDGVGVVSEPTLR